MKTLQTVGYTSVAGALIYAALIVPAGAQTTPQGAGAPAAPAATPAGCQPGQDLITIPEIRRSKEGKLRAEITLTSGTRTLWGSAGDTRCGPHEIRYFKGRDLLTNSPEDPAFSSGAPIPGPTLRARAGDLIQVKFLNEVDPRNFPATVDQNARTGKTTGCDEVRSNTQRQPIYPNASSATTVGDVMPNCLHGSSTANLHFHGTHTTPNTTGDNILLFVTPALRNVADRKIAGPDPALVDKTFEEIFDACEKNGSPTAWKQLPKTWTDDQKRLLKQYDAQTTFQGKPGPLPKNMQLWRANASQIRHGRWPQYQLGAFPYCFRLADAKGHLMGQSPGTHWYHAHKHGSTALNVANGMTGAFIIEGQYDDDLRAFYGSGFRDQVLVIQQLSTTPFPVLNPGTGGPNSVAKPQLSVNGGLNPVVKMRPGEVQLWRLVNGAFRDAVQLNGFFPADGVAWRQIAQDGVQFAFKSYTDIGTVNNAINLAPANRADLLVKAPLKRGQYALVVEPNAGLPLECLKADKGCTKGAAQGLPDNFKPQPTVTLLTVSVEGPPLDTPQDFIQKESDFPKLPPFLADIPAKTIHRTDRVVNFGAAHNLIDGKPFNPDEFKQTMLLNTAEQWKVLNQATDKAHPFHIHINPFQITEVFAPNAENTADPSSPCYIDPMDPKTWKPCAALQGPFVWWDTFAIPTSKQYDVTAECKGTRKSRCPKPIREFVECAPKDAPTACTLTIPGHFRMRSRFVDFPGTFVLHCHILIHEDRGMMQLVRVEKSLKGLPTKPPYSHH